MREGGGDEGEQREGGGTREVRVRGAKYTHTWQAWTQLMASSMFSNSMRACLRRGIIVTYLHDAHVHAGR